MDNKNRRRKLLNVKRHDFIIIKHGFWISLAVVVYFFGDLAGVDGVLLYYTHCRSAVGRSIFLSLMESATTLLAFNAVTGKGEGDDSFTSWIQGGNLIRAINELLCKWATLIYGCKWKIILGK